MTAELRAVSDAVPSRSRQPAVQTLRALAETATRRRRERGIA